VLDSLGQLFFDQFNLEGILGDRFLVNGKIQPVGLVRFGNEALDRRAACPAEAVPEQIAKSILWMQAPRPS
jgi:hypothetical protein